ncbi:adenylate/guanylate cyclase domain-containing protein, partial [Hyalangium sp.]|uniref:adenylate/guanylate cyclase domain-containing protein n=1 Tax=Hyalangium sp. TaxID=2028555 RepID=UPI002D2BB076
MKTANLAIVFTDIKGFTERTSRQTHVENERLLQVHHDLLAPLFKAFGGRIIKSIGDAFLVTFESPTQAVLSGVAIQDRLWQYNRSVPESAQLHVRVAVNVGEVRLEASDVFGEPVNIASRVEGIAEA